jgi:hypothetical protein
MAREYLARRIANPLQAWARHRIRLLADALLRHSTLSGEQIFELAA